MEQKQKKGFAYTFGIILILVGLFMLFKNAYVTTFAFYSFGRVNTGAILIVLLLLAVVYAVVRPSTLSKVLIGVIVAALVLSLLLGMHIGFRYMSLTDVLLILAPLAVGIGLVLRGVFYKD